MTVRKLFTCRGVRSEKRWAMVTMLALLASTVTRPDLLQTVRAQGIAASTPVGQGFALDAGDLRFIYQQILVAQDHAAGGTLLGPGPNQVADPQLPRGLRTVDGSFNNLVPGQEHFGKADVTFPRLTTPVFRPAEALTMDPDGPGPQTAGSATSYAQKKGVVSDSQPRIISNLIVDQSANNPAAVAAATNPCGEGGFVCSGTAEPDPDSGALFIPNITPDFGLSAPFNLTFAFFGQFFDHGLDLVTKAGGAVIIPLQPDDPLYDPGSQTNFMVITRGQNQPGPDGVLGDDPATPQDESADDVQEAMNTTTPWVDQNQTYTSHPSHQVFLREYALNTQDRPVPSGKVLDGGFCADRGTGIPGDQICNIGNWAEMKSQAASMLGIRLTDQDVFNVPLLLTDPYGHFKPGPRGYPQIVLPGNALLEGDPRANGGAGIDIPADAFRTGHAFLDDIAHNAVPRPGLVPDADGEVGAFGVTVQPVGTYDDELLDRHFATGDGRGNENIALTAVHQLFHAEHNRLVHYIDRLLPQVLTPEEVAAWHSLHPGSGWAYGERLFQAARFVTEMEYQHLVFEEFARKVQPLINPFLGGITSINGVISAEFAHTVYRLGHSMLPEVVGRLDANGTASDMRLLHAFLNPIAYNDAGPAGVLNAAQAAGSIIRGTSRQVANELDEFVTSSVRETLLGLPLDLAAINIARGRSEGIPPLNEVRRQFFAATRNSALAPYANWFEFGLSLKHYESLPNFIAAYGTHPSITRAATVADKRAAAQTLVNASAPFLFEPAATSGLDAVDFWVGGLAERQAVFGGLLGSTFNFVFEMQLEHLQDGDRFYYLQRTDGINLKTQLEGNSLAELARRNSDLDGTMDVVFDTADFILDVTSFTGTAPVDLGDGASLLTLADGTKMFFDPEHRGKNIVFNGSAGADRLQADIGDDSIFGNGGNDRIEGGEGNDTLLGGAGDDVLFGQNGDDVLKGGPGNDAMSAGPGFGADLLLGAEGNDFMVGGDDGDEYFAGAGNDFVLDGSTRSEAIVGDAGDDWLDAGDGHDGGMFGDHGNIFDLLAGLDVIGGDDVMDGGPGQDNLFGEGGDDIFLMSEGSNKFFGDFGFDWVTQRGWPAAADIELDLFALAGVPLNFNDLRNKYRLVDGASGWNLDDHIRGDHMVNDPAAPIEFRLLPGMELTAAGAAKITGLTDLVVDGFGKALPFMGGNILLGGAGSDILEGKGGDDLIDGDRWLNVQLEATMNDGTIKRVDNIRDLVDDVLADPQRLNPGNIRIVRNIVSPVVPPADCGVAAPKNCDTAAYGGPASEYAILTNANGTVTVVHQAGVGLFGLRNDGTDTLRNIERLQFADGALLLVEPSGEPILLPNVVGLTQAAATNALTSLGLTVAIATANSTIVPAGIVISQSPSAFTGVASGSAVTLVVSLGPPNVLVPGVLGLSQAAASSAITAVGLTVGAIGTANSLTVPAGSVISQSPIGGTSVPPGSAVTLVISLGPPLVAVPNVVGQTQAAATTAITTAGLTVGTIATATSLNVPSGSVISQTPAFGATVLPGTAVSLVVSSGRPAGLVLALGFDESSGATAVDASGGGRNGTILEAARVPGKVGGALRFDGVNDWVTVPDSAALDLTTGMTVEAWVNPTAMSGWETIALKERGVEGLAYALYAHDGGAASTTPPAGYVNIGGIDRRVTGATPIALNTWTHVATTYDGSTMRVYVNGVQVGSRAQAGTISVSGGALRIGGNSSFSGEFFSGLIDELRVYNRALGAAEIAADMGNTTATTPPPPPPAPEPSADGLVLALNFDETSGDVALDSSGGSRNGTILEAVRVPGKVGSALSFDGLNDWVTVADAAALDLASSMTLEAWVRPSTLAGWNTVLVKEGAGAFAYALYANDDVPRPAGYVRIGSIDRGVAGTQTLPLDEWSHVAVTYDGTVMRLYVNGTLTANVAQAGAMPATSGVLRIGGNAIWGEFFSGLIDQVRVYNRALSAAEIASDMNAGGTNP